MSAQWRLMSRHRIAISFAFQGCYCPLDTPAASGHSEDVDFVSDPSSYIAYSHWQLPWSKEVSVRCARSLP